MAELLMDFLARETLKPPMVIGRGILPVKGKAILAGAPKAGKSFVVLNLAINLAKGMNIFDATYKNQTPVFPVTKPYNVLMIEQEVGEDGLRGRLRNLVTTDEAICPLYIKSKELNLRLDTQDGILGIEREVEECQAQVVILDPLSKFHNVDENSAEHMGRVMRAGDYLIQKHGVSLLYIHHTGLAVYDPQNFRKGGARMRGSSAVFADVDTFIEVNNLSGPSSLEPTLKLSMELRQGEPLRPQFVKRLKSGRIIYVGEDTASFAGGT